MHHSRIRLHFGLITTVACLLSACGSSGESDLNANSGEVAVSATAALPVIGLHASAQGASTKALGPKVDPIIRPGAESPLDSAPDRVSKEAGTRFFATGFEEGVVLSRDSAERAQYQYLSGADQEGYAFPIVLGDAASTWPSRVNAEVGRSSLAPDFYAFASLKKVMGRDGHPTRALSLHSRSKSHAIDAQQISLENAGLSLAPVVFQRMWLKFDAGTLERARQQGSDRFYQTFWEVKGQGDFWLRLKLHFDPGHGLTWAAKGNGLDSPEPSWKASMKKVPVALGGTDETAGWHRVDIWLDSVSGRFKVTIDGETLVDRVIGRDGSRIRDYRMAMVGSTVAPLAEVTVDGLELWDQPPTDAFQAAAQPAERH
jgi:hypothetical protein